MKRFLALYLPVSDLKLLRAIARRCFNLTPFVGIESNLKRLDLEKSILTRGLILDMTGTSRLFPSEERLAAKIKSELSKNNVDSCLAFAPTIGSAWAFSRFSKEKIYINKGFIRDELYPLPLRALRISEKEFESLQETGLSTFKDLFKLSYKDIGHRFGENVFLRLNQILGRIEEPLRLLKLSEQISVKRNFDIPLGSKELVSRWVNIILEDLFKKLKNRILHANAYEIYFLLENKSIITRNISLYLASSNYSHITSVIETNIENITFNQGVITIKITALDLKPPTESQSDIFNPKSIQYDQEKSLAEYLNLVSQKIGKENIKKATFLDSYMPEKSYAFTPLDKAVKEGCPAYMKDRPSTIFPKPQAVSAIAMLPDKAPSRLNIKGEHLRILKGFGPERINYEWWNSNLNEANLYRDYFKVLDEKGRWLWLYREAETHKWFLHGIWT